MDKEFKETGFYILSIIIIIIILGSLITAIGNRNDKIHELETQLQTCEIRLEGMNDRLQATQNIHNQMIPYINTKRIKSSMTSGEFLKWIEEYFGKENICIHHSENKNE